MTRRSEMSRQERLAEDYYKLCRAVEGPGGLASYEAPEPEFDRRSRELKRAYEANDLEAAKKIMNERGDSDERVTSGRRKANS